MPRFAAFAASALRRAGVISGLDRLASSVVLIHVTVAGMVYQATTPPQKQRLLDDATTRDPALAAWRGQYDTDTGIDSRPRRRDRFAAAWPIIASLGA